MTLRTLLHLVDLEKVFVHLSERDRMDLNEVKQKYTTVINTLFKKPFGKAFLPIEVQYGQDQGYDVFARNPKYVAPKEGLLPWGCRRGEKPPKGYYDANARKHCQIFAIGFTSWDKIIDSEIVSSLSPEVTVAEVLREITFYGWSEKDIKKQFDVIDQRVKEAIKEVEGGRASKLRSCSTCKPHKMGKANRFQQIGFVLCGTTKREIGDAKRSYNANESQ